MKKFLVLAMVLAGCSTLQSNMSDEKKQKVQCISTYALTFNVVCSNDKACVKNKVKSNYKTVSKKCNLENVNELIALYDDVQLMKEMSAN